MARCVALPDFCSSPSSRYRRAIAPFAVTLRLHTLSHSFSECSSVSIATITCSLTLEASNRPVIRSLGQSFVLLFCAAFDYIQWQQSDHSLAASRLSFCRVETLLLSTLSRAAWSMNVRRLVNIVLLMFRWARYHARRRSKSRSVLRFAFVAVFEYIQWVLFVVND